MNNFIICYKKLDYVCYKYIKQDNTTLSRYVHYNNSSSFFKEKIMNMKPLRLILINIER